MKRAILLSVPCSICNFRCSYCYLTTRPEAYQNRQPDYGYTPEHVARALSQKRLGGAAYINICADGETLLAENIDKYVYELLREGHYVEFVTNLTASSVLDRMLSWDKKLLKRLGFKCSFHYIQLLEKGMLDTFAANVQKIWEAGASASIEITPHDELIPYLEEIKEFSWKSFKALPHITIARDDSTSDIRYLTKLSLEEYDRIWSAFDSDFWRFKKDIFMIRRKEFCYADEWLLYVNLATGEAKQCYKSNYSQNIFSDLDKAIDFVPIGKCKQPHCYNGHMLLTLGCIPDFTSVGYGDIRNRKGPGGEQWMTPEMIEFLNGKLYETNGKRYAAVKQRILLLKNEYYAARYRLGGLIKRVVDEGGE